MANRILLDDTGLKISKPGVNVLTASPVDFLFNSDWSQVGILQSGTFQFNGDSIINVVRYVSWPTRAKPPLVFFAPINRDDNIQRSVVGMNGLRYAATDGSGGLGTWNTSHTLRVQNDGIYVQQVYNIYSGSGSAIPDFRYYYVALDFGIE